MDTTYRRKIFMETGNTDKFLITPMEACKLLGVGRTTMYAWIKNHTIPVVRFPNCRNIYISTEALRQLIDENTIPCGGAEMAKGTNGSGTVFKPKHPSKNLPFRAEVWITDLTRPNGKRRISKNFKKKSQAEAWRDDTLRKYGSHGNNSTYDPEITLAQWLDYWLKVFCINIKDSTRTGYEGYIHNHIARHPIGKVRLKDLNVCDIQTYIAYLLSDGNLRDGGGMSPKTVRSLVLMLRKSMRAAIGADLIDKNPADYVVLPAIEKKEVEYLTPDQISSLIHASKGERWEIFFVLAFMTGCRIGELAALRRSSIRQENGITFLAVEGSLNRVKDYSAGSENKTILRIGQTKNCKSRQIPLTAEIVRLLHEHFHRQDLDAVRSCGAYEKDPFIFSNELGGLVDPQTIRNWSKEIAEKAGVEGFHPHLLRKSFATIGAANMDLKQLSAILGHSSVNVSTTYYIGSDLTTKSNAIYFFRRKSTARHYLGHFPASVEGFKYHFTEMF